MNIDLYVQKLGLERKPPTLNFLDELIRAHQERISFNNLAVYFRPGVLLDLDLEPLFAKVVLRVENKINSLHP